MAQLLVTRPIEQGEELADRLRALGHEVLVEPMLRVRLADAALPPLDGVQAVLLTSRNGARALAGATDRRDIRLLAVGDATAAEARAAGFDQIDSADGDAADLVEYAARQLRPEDGPVLHVSGFDVAVDVAAELAARGFQADRVVLYEADTVEALSPAAHQALAGQAIDAVLFHSPRAARTFAGLVDNAGLALKLRSVTALALSDHVAESIRHLDWQAIRVAEQPNETALLALLGPPAATRPLPAASVPKRSRAPGLVTAAIVGSIAGAAAAYGVVRWLPVAVPAQPVQVSPPMPDTTSMERRLATLEQSLDAIRSPAAEINALSARLAALEGRPMSAPADPSPRLDQLAERLERLEARPAPGTDAGADQTAERVTGLDEKVRALGERVEALTARSEAPSDLPDRVAAVEREAKAIADRLAATAPPAGEALRLALVLSVAELADQVISGRPYADALAQVESLFGDDKSLIAPLQAQASSGVPALPALRRDFDQVARRVIEAAAGEGDHWLDHVRGRMAALFVLRRTGEVAGDASDAVVARTETRLQDGDLAAATAEIAKLTGRPAEAAAAWLRQAQARIDAEMAVAALKRRTLEIARAGVK